MKMIKSLSLATLILIPTFAKAGMNYQHCFIDNEASHCKKYTLKKEDDFWVYNDRNLSINVELDKSPNFYEIRIKSKKLKVNTITSLTNKWLLIHRHSTEVDNGKRINTITEEGFLKLESKN
ncbi:hypothetical protein ACPV5G_20600 [Photobacterium damselae]|uniref:hypothetical protein n=1 Tax=Photobacterium damselae TaxID=38293 RepID=UPI004067E0B7